MAIKDETGSLLLSAVSKASASMLDLPFKSRFAESIHGAYEREIETLSKGWESTAFVGWLIRFTPSGVVHLVHELQTWRTRPMSGWMVCKA